MTRSDHDRIVAILAGQAMLDPEQITLRATPADLGIDSLGLVESTFAIEEASGIVIPFNANEPGQSAFDVSSLASIIAANRDAGGRKGMTALAMATPQSPRRVAITGMGTINALGHNVPETLDAMREGRCGIGETTGSPSSRCWPQKRQWRSPG